MHRETKKNPWLSSVARTDSRLGDLATKDMEEGFREILINSARDGMRQRFVLIVLQSLTHGQVIGALSDLLMKTVRDDSWLLGVRRQALGTFIEYREQGMGTEDLRALLEDIHTGSVSDPDDELLGILLKDLYPEILSISDLLKYLKTPKDPSLHGKYVSFWFRHFPENSTDAQLVEFLDTIIERFDQFPVLHYTEFRAPDHDGITFFDRGRLLTHLLARFLARFPENAQKSVFSVVSMECLSDWLEFVLDERFCSSSETRSINSWLSSHPDEYKEMIKTGIRRCTESCDFLRCADKIEYRFRDVTRPPDFGIWCLEQAVSSIDARTKKYLIYQVADSVYGHRHDEGLSREIVEERLADDHATLDAFMERLGSREYTDKQQQEMQQRTGEEDDAGRSLRRQQQWSSVVEHHRVALRKNRCKPVILHQLAEIYCGTYSDTEGDTPEGRLRDLFDDDVNSIEVVLEGLRGSIHRTNVPDTEEIIRLFTENRIHMMTLPFLAGLEVVGGSVGERQMRQALAAYYTRSVRRYDNQPPTWYNSILESHADVAADVLIRFVRAEIRSGNKVVSGVSLLQDSDVIGRLASMPLLRTFPVRCSTWQLHALGVLLGAALRLREATEVLELTDTKLARRSMDTGQRVHWLVTGILASDSVESYRERLMEYASGRERRIRYLTAFVDRLADWIHPECIRNPDTPVLQLLIKLMGGSYGPVEPPGFDSGSRLIHEFINKLAILPSPEATRALDLLSDDDALQPWRPYLVDAMDRQNTVRREADFRYSAVDQVLKTLDGNRPANVADLAALTFDFLTELARNIRDGNTSDWRQYWNWDGNSHRQPLKTMHEDHCRDRLLSDLRSRVGPLDIDAAPEGRYADEKRSDIRVSYGGFNVPVEIKKSDHRNLWSAIRNQLIAKYTRDPGAGGHGIYVVFWLGKEHCQPPESGTRPGSAIELEARLRDSLSPEEARMIGVRVIDVAEPSA